MACVRDIQLVAGKIAADIGAPRPSVYRAMRGERDVARWIREEVATRLALQGIDAEAIVEQDRAA